MKLNILGEAYNVLGQTKEQNPKLEENSGLCEPFAKKLILDVADDNEDGMDVENIEEFYRKTLRHEIFHAILFEAGLTQYYADEVLVDALATLYPKIEKIMSDTKTFDYTKLKKN